MAVFSRIDIYIIKRYFITFFFSAFLFTMISVVIDLSERVQKFIDNHLSLHQVISEYYIHFIPYINGILWPLFSLLAVVFFTSRLAKNSEIIAALSAGISFNRLLRPYFIASCMLALVHFTGTHYFIPKGNKTFIAFDNQYIHPDNRRTKTDNIHIYLDANSKIFIRNYRSHDTSMRNVFLELYDGVELKKLIDADRMEWLGPPSRWRLSNYQIRTFDGDRESIVNGRNAHFDTTINLVPEDFVRYANQREMMTSKELRDFIAYENAKGLGTARPMITELHRRSADPYTLIVLTVIGVSVAARKTRGGVGLHLATGVMIGALYIILSRFATTFASQLDLPAGMSVWLPNILFTLVAIYLVLRAQK